MNYSGRQLEYIEGVAPILDREGRFAFFPQHKCAQTSIVRVLLKNRAVVKKDNIRRYELLFSRFDFSEVYSFTVVRNPYDRVVSAFLYLQRNMKLPKEVEFREFIRDTDLFCYDVHFEPMVPRIVFNDELLVDEIVKLETIDKQWPKVAMRIGCDGQLPHENLNDLDTDYASYYDTESRRIIMKLYRDDFEYLGYHS